jgi:3'-phosphoadenosine 5'-phosphosulfate sulfotransferase (PAPS reductase)/FAD synthetase
MSNENQPTLQENRIRHILALSGGKDSTALAIYMKDRVPEMEYVFCDTEKELKETYDYLDKLQVYLGKPIIRLKHDGMGFDDLLKIRSGFLPSPQVRWCTDYLKIKPYEKYIGEQQVTSYVGIRADEPQRKGYISTKSNISARFPFIEDGLIHADILAILESSGLGLPEYYKWRSRSGCFFCFYQQRREWIGLLEKHPELFEEAKKYERIDSETGEHYTWVQNESLEEISKPQRIEQIKADYSKRMLRDAKFQADSALANVFDGSSDHSGSGCLICHL